MSEEGGNESAHRRAFKVKYGLLKGFARTNRAEPTTAEAALWEALRKHKPGGVRWRRQFIIGGNIVDFVALRLNLIVEVDGRYHDTDQQQLLDEEREAYLNGIGYTIFRTTNEAVLTECLTVIERIDAVGKSQAMRRDNVKRSH